MVRGHRNSPQRLGLGDGCGAGSAVRSRCVRSARDDAACSGGR
ncbi:hypothetical protein NK6_5393 [Bradyrhizobium diazoefficiens]|uniref:Uncharacterized protein n=1 Tax=Bradyrhizobium diazoefficiens TaxID=1355477 RepID=A0A0E4BR04_9BRAD|nr:hypothetical protein NK6_5393 [Bradyrhizobium diazoefficiens]